MVIMVVTLVIVHEGVLKHEHQIPLELARCTDLCMRERAYEMN